MERNSNRDLLYSSCGHCDPSRGLLSAGIVRKWYMTVANGLKTKVLIGAVNDLLLVVTAVGTAVMLFPYLRRWNEQMALGYLCFRFMEAVFIAIGLVSILGLLQLSIYYEAGSLAIEENHLAIGFMLQSFHRWTSVLGPNLMLGLNTVMLWLEPAWFQSR